MDLAIRCSAIERTKVFHGCFAFAAFGFVTRRSHCQICCRRPPDDCLLLSVKWICYRQMRWAEMGFGWTGSVSVALLGPDSCGPCAAAVILIAGVELRRGC
ncbi:hypothetical protein ACLOJK_027206 [Asimina triloba]